MASATQKKNIRKKRQASKMGKRRKRQARNKGTTPKFPIHVEG